MVIFDDSITKLIVPNQIIKCNEREISSFSSSGGKVKDIYYKRNYKGSKVEDIVISAGTNHIQRERPRDRSRKNLQTSTEGKI